MKPLLFKYLFAGILALGFLSGTAFGVNAVQAVPKVSTVINLTGIASVNLGDAFILSGNVKTYYGKPVSNKDVSLAVDGTTIGRAHTDSNGFFERRFMKLYSAGTYTVSASTTETHYLMGAKASTSLEILPAVVRVQTVPSIAGLSFGLAGQVVTSGQNGEANISIEKPGRYPLTILVNQYNNPDERIEFARWTEETFTPYLYVDVPTNKVIQVGFNVFMKVGQSFVDPKGFPVDPKRVSQFTIRSAQGDLFTFTDGQPRWIPASRVARRPAGLVPTPLMYSVISMMVDGSNVVNKSQQQFFASPNGDWKISLILYSLTIRANDGLFKSSVGKSIKLVYPDGSIKNYDFDKSGSVTIDSLARGNYSVEVLNTKGLSQVIPVALSRSQTVDINVPTGLDIAIVISIGGLIMLGLLAFGRRKLIGSLFRRNKLVYQPVQANLEKAAIPQGTDENSVTPRGDLIKWL
jgi:hypothetical protein